MNLELCFLGGKKLSGKDFIADTLAARAGFTKYHLVRPWLEGFCQRHGVSYAQYEQEKGKWREQVQREAVAEREKDPAVLVKAFVKALPSLPRPLAVVGLRFAIEGRMAISLGGLMLRVTCPDDVRTERFRKNGESLALFDDPFEREVDLMPVHAEIDGTLDQDAIVPLVESIANGVFS